MLEPCGGAKVVRLARFSTCLRERVDNLTQMSWSLGGQQLLLNSLAVDEESGLVARLQDGLGKRDSGSGGLIKLREVQQQVVTPRIAVDGELQLPPDLAAQRKRRARKAAGVE